MDGRRGGGLQHLLSTVLHCLLVCLSPFQVYFLPPQRLPFLSAENWMHQIHKVWMVAPKLTMVTALFFCTSLSFLALPGAVILDHVRSDAIQNGSAQASWKDGTSYGTLRCNSIQLGNCQLYIWGVCVSQDTADLSWFATLARSRPL